MSWNDEWLWPSSRWKPLLDRGVVTIKRQVNRLIWNRGPRKRTFAARLVPSTELARRLAALPVAGSTSTKLATLTQGADDLEPALEVLPRFSTTGAIASVAGVGASIARFAIAMTKLGRIEGRLDEMLGRVERLRQAIAGAGAALESYSLAWLKGAHDQLDGAVAATAEPQRLALARGAHRLFVEARQRYLALWTLTDPWYTPSIDLVIARELQGRYVACAVGELQAELILGDRSAYERSARAIMADLQGPLALDSCTVLGVRRAALAEGSVVALAGQAVNRGALHRLAYELVLAMEETDETIDCLQAAALDADLPELLEVPAHEMLRRVQGAPGVDVYALGRLGHDGYPYD